MNKVCEICGKPVAVKVTGNPKLSHFDCLFKAMADVREKLKNAGGSNGLIKK